MKPALLSCLYSRRMNANVDSSVTLFYKDIHMHTHTYISKLQDTNFRSTHVHTYTHTHICTRGETIQINIILHIVFKCIAICTLLYCNTYVTGYTFHIGIWVLAAIKEIYTLCNHINSKKLNYTR